MKAQAFFRNLCCSGGSMACLSTGLFFWTSSPWRIRRHFSGKAKRVKKSVLVQCTHLNLITNNQAQGSSYVFLSRFSSESPWIRKKFLCSSKHNTHAFNSRSSSGQSSSTTSAKDGKGICGKGIVSMNSVDFQIQRLLNNWNILNYIEIYWNILQWSMRIKIIKEMVYDEHSISDACTVLSSLNIRTLLCIL